MATESQRATDALSNLHLQFSIPYMHARSSHTALAKTTKEQRAPLTARWSPPHTAPYVGPTCQWDKHAIIKGRERSSTVQLWTTTRGHSKRHFAPNPLEFSGIEEGAISSGSPAAAEAGRDAALRDGGGGGGGAGEGDDGGGVAVVQVLGGDPGLRPLLAQHPLPLRRLHARAAPRRAPRAPRAGRRGAVQAAAQGAALPGGVLPLLQGRHAPLLPRHRPAPARVLPYRQGAFPLLFFSAALVDESAQCCAAGIRFEGRTRHLVTTRMRRLEFGFVRWWVIHQFEIARFEGICDPGTLVRCNHMI